MHGQTTLKDKHMLNRAELKTLTVLGNEGHLEYERRAPHYMSVPYVCLRK